MEVRFLGSLDRPSSASAVDMLDQASVGDMLDLASVVDMLDLASVVDTLDLASAEGKLDLASAEDTLDLESTVGTDQEFDTTLDTVDQQLVVLHSLGLMVFRNYPFIIKIILINLKRFI